MEAAKANAQPRQSLHCSSTQCKDIDEGSDQNIRILTHLIAVPAFFKSYFTYGMPVVGMDCV